MASDQYAPIVGGALKLKGSAPCGIQKKKKTKKNTKANSSSSGSAEMTTSTSTVQQALTDQDARKPVEREEKAEREGEGKERRIEKKRGRGKERRESDRERSLEGSDGNGKTPAERAHEEMRRKRLHDRLAKEGLKTHKQRVEELNKYLSNLSEHHDMPRIGPG